ncbi:MAG: thioether cross-link-forming SCIFF peptide maturase [Oscillospiraceae bacterium]|nr:thioether cross-link-forming SCIFF peptide maturase [Oscillospiraceae bacterium]
MIHRYKLGGFNIVIDAASGAIHSADDAAFDAIGAYESLGREGAIRHIANRYSGMPADEAHKVIDEIDKLISDGKLFSEADYSALAEKAGVLPLKALCLNISHQCNMACGYCFAGQGRYGGAGALMSIETGRRAVDFLLESSGARKNLYIDFFGGEPLLNFGAVRDVVEYARGKEHSSGKRFRFTLTTNGLLIDDEVVEFTTAEMENVVLSLDGRPETNDAFRKCLDGTGAYAHVLPLHKKLIDARGGTGYYIRGTYTRRNTGFTEDILHMADLGFRELSMEPVVAPEDAPYSLTEAHLEELCGQYELLAGEMLKREQEGAGFTFYHFKLDATGGPCLYKRLAGCGVGTEYLAVTPEGDLYPCHQFVGDERFRMGDIFNGVENEELAKLFQSRNRVSRPECEACWARLYCGGACAAGAYHASGSVSGVYKLGCELFKKRIECAVMMEVARAAR